MDPSEATAFFIPYDIGFDAAIRKDSAKIRPHGCPNAESVIALLENNTYFKRNYGYDHFLVQGLNQAMGNFNLRCVVLEKSNSNVSYNSNTTDQPASYF